MELDVFTYENNLNDVKVPHSRSYLLLSDLYYSLARRILLLKRIRLLIVLLLGLLASLYRYGTSKIPNYQSSQSNCMV